jgi:hypothetical protein
MSSHVRRAVLNAVLMLLVVSAMLPLAGCSTEQATETTPPETDPSEATATGEPTDESAEEPSSEPAAEIAWANIELTDVQTGETFTISELEGGPVLVQAFAVW